MVRSLLLLPALVGSLAAAPPPAATADFAGTYATYAALLGRYVTPAGVRYAAWRGNAADLAALGEVVGQLDAAAPARLPSAERFALYINLYNAKTLELVLRGNPKESIKDLSDGAFGYEIFKRDVLTLGGEPLTLEELETRLRRESGDPRVHFAVNCASRSCPPVLGEPFRGATLDAQLDRVTRDFLAAPGNLGLAESKGLLGGTTLEVSVSKIFDWYADDFAPAGGVTKFLARHAPAAAAQRIAAAGDAIELVYQEYDWSLNGVR